LRRVIAPAQLTLSESKRLRFFAFTAFYFAQGIPIGLLNVALPAWLAEQGYSAAQIGSFVAAIGLPWAFKLVAGPFMDRYQFAAMGFRRPWVMAAQVGLMLSLAALGLVSGGGDLLFVLMAVGFLANSFAAAQDVAVDGLAIDVLPKSEYGRANALMVFGQVVGYGVFGGLSGILLAHAGLAAAALVAAAAVFLIFLVCLLTRERPGEKLLPWSPGAAAAREVQPARSLLAMFGDLVKATVLPMSLLLMAGTVLARVVAGMALVIYPVFAVNELGLASDTYSQVISVIYMVAALLGLAVGPLIDRFTARRIAIVSMVSVATVWGLFSLTSPWWGSTAFVLTIVVLIEVGMQAFMISIIAQHMNITWIKIAATQFAVYMAIANLGRSAGSAVYAALSDVLGTQQIFLVMAVLMLLAGLMLLPFSESRHQSRLRLLAVTT
jgi:PAT family beta-lactamase induction signal transducer AmpG